MELLDDGVERIAELVRRGAEQVLLPYSADELIARWDSRIALVERADLPIDMAATVLESGRFAIVVRAGLPAEQRRFALACGLGHVLLDDFASPCAWETPWPRNEPSETRAETFALSLLVPSIELRRRLVQPVCVSRLARAFGVPQWVIARRLVHLACSD